MSDDRSGAQAREDAASLDELTAIRAQRHSWVDDLVGLLTGVLVAALGLAILRSGEVATGGTAGVALILSYATPLGFGLLFAAVNAPFFVLAAIKKGWRFTLRTLVAIAAVSVIATFDQHLLDVELPPWFAGVTGSVLAGVGLLILFRHGASLGGFNIVALLLQERFGWRAGYVQMAFDALVVLAALPVVGPIAFLWSIVGAVAMNLVLALNHRPGRYIGF